VLEQVLRRYPSVQMMIADGVYDKESLLEWLWSEFCVALDCVWREGKGFYGVGGSLVGGAPFGVVVGLLSVVAL
jgi:hypothetical protein